MADSRRITYSVGFNVDKSGLTQVEKAMDAIRDLTAQDISLINNKGLSESRKDLLEIRKQASLVEEAFQKAFNYKLNTVNINSFNRELAKSGTNLNTVYKNFKQAGVAGENAFRTLSAQTLKNNFQLKETSSLLNEIGTTFKNTIKWNIASSAINNLTGSIQQAYGYVKNLDSSLNDIRIVTGASADAMDVFAQKANKAAGELKKSTTDYTNAALIYYQQGLGDEEVAARTEVTLKAANVTGQDTAEVSEQLTAIWNGYKVEAAEAELYIDKVAAVAATTASDLEELATGMSKVASAADLMGVDIDQLNAQIATIISVTRQAPESVGTALKTIYARMGDIEAGIDTETTLGNYTQEMAAMGVNVLDMNGQLRDMGEVIEEIGGKWNTMSREQQIALSQTMAGTRQYNNLLSLFDNWDMYTDALNTSANAAGTLQEQQDIFAESSKANLQELATAAEGVYDSLLNADMINSVAGFLTPLVQGVEHFVDSLGGGMGVLRVFGPLLLKSFGPEISENILKFSKNLKAAEHNAAMMENQLKLLEQFQGIEGLDESTKMLFENQEALTLLSSTMKPEEFNEMSAQIQDYTEKINEQATAQDKANKISERYSKALGKDISFKELFEVDDWDKIGTVITRNVEQAEDALTLLGDSFQQLSVDNYSYEDILSEGFISQDLADKLKIDFSKIVDEKSFNEAKDKLTNFISNAQDLAGEENADEISQINTELQEFSQEAEEAGQSITDYLSDQAFETRIQGFVDLGSAVMSAVGSLQTLAGIGDIWSDENLSVGEKLVQTMMAIGTSTISLKGAWDTAKGALDKFTAASRTEALVSLEQAAANEIENATERSSTAENIRNTTSTVAQTTAETAEAAASGAQAGANAVKSAGMLKTVGSAIGKAFSGAAAAIGVSTAALGILLGALAAAGVATYAIVKALNKEKDAAESAKIAAEELAKQHQAVKESYDELITSITNYKEARDAIEDLTIGTQEWKNAIQEANEQVLTLLEKYPELAQYVSNINGQLSISDEGLNQLAEQQNQEVQTAYQKELIGKTIARSTQGEYDKVKAREDIFTRAGFSKEEMESVLQAIQTNGNAIFADAELLKQTTGIQDGLIAALMANSDELLALNASLEENTKINLLQNEQAARSFLMNSDNQDYQSLDEATQQIIDSMVGASMIIQGQSSDKDNEYDNTIRDKYDDMLDSEIHKLYAEAMGYTETAGFDIGGSNFKDSEGNKTGLISDEVQREFLAQQEALKQAGVELDKYIKSFQLITDIGNTFVQGAGESFATFAGGKGGDLSGLTEAQMQAAQEQLELGRFNLWDEDAKNLGYESGEAYAKAVEEAINDYKLQLNDFNYSLTGAVKTAFDNVDTENMTLSMKQNVKEIFDNAFNFLGQEGLASAQNAVNSILNNTDLDNTQIETLFTKIAETDFSNVSISEFNKELRNMDIYIDEVDLQALIDAQKAAIQSTDSMTQSVSELNTNLSTLYELLKSVSLGSIISDEQYKILVDLNAELAKYFSQDTSGNWLYTGQEDLKELIDLSEYYNETLEKNAEKKARFDALNEKGSKDWNYSDIAANLSSSELQDLTGLSSDAVKQFQDMYKNLSKTLDKETVEKNLEAYIKKNNLGNSLDLIKAFSAGYTETAQTIQATLTEASKQNYEEFIQLKETYLQNKDNIKGEIDPQTLEDLEKAALKLDAESKGVKDFEAEVDKFLETTNDSLTAYKKAYESSIMNVGLDDLRSSWEKNQEALKGPELSTDYINALKETKEQLSNILGFEISDQMVLDNKDKIQAIVDGEKDAIDEFRAYIKSSNWSIDLELQIPEENQQEISDKLDEIAKKTINIEVGAFLNGEAEQAVMSLIALLEKIDPNIDVNSILSGLGFAKVTTGSHGEYKVVKTGSGKDADASANLPDADKGTDKEVTLLEKEADAYAEINNEISYYNNQLEELKARQEDLEGADLLENLHAQHELQEKLLEIEREKLAMKQAEAELVKNELAGQGVKFDENGLTTNRQEVYNRLVDRVNAARNGGVDENIKAAEKALEDFEEAIDNYDNIALQDIPDSLSKINDALDELDSSDIIEDFIDKFYELDREIKDIEEELDDLKRAASRLEGIELIQNLEQQKKVLDRQIAVQEKKIKLQQIELKQQQDILRQYMAQLMLEHNMANIKLQFADDGTIKNYLEIWGALTEKASEITETEMQAIANMFEIYNTLVENTESMKDELDNLFDSQQDIDWEIEDEYERMAEEAAKKLEEEMNERLRLFNLEADLKLDVAEARRQWNEFKRKVIDDIDDSDILGNAKARFQDFFSYYGDGLGSIGVLTEHVNDIMGEINLINAGGTSSLYGTDKEQALEDMKNYRDQLVSALEEVVDLQNELEDSYMEMIDKIADKFNEQVELYGTISDTISHDMELIRLIRGEDSYDELAKYYEQQQANNNSQLILLKEQVNYWKSRMDSTEEGSEEWEKYKENWKSAVSELNSTVDTSVQNLIDKYQNMVNKVFEDLNNSVTNYVGLDYLSEEWDLINKNADKYLDKVNSLFEIDSLENKFQQAIDDTDSLKAQQRLTELMNEQLEMLREKDKLTQYDVDRANLLYELELKKIALEEAQQNKSQLRLRRDSQGNYSYQYVADQEAVGNAEQELSEAQNSVYNLDKDQYNQNLNEIYDLYTEFQEKLSALYQDQTLTEEEREQKKQLLVANYGELINGTIAENEVIRQNLQQSTFDSLAGLYGMSVQDFQNMTDTQKEIMMNQMIPEWDSGLQEMANSFSGEDGFITMCEEAIKVLEEATKEYQDGLAELEEAAGINFGNLLDEGIDPTISETQELINTNDELIGKYEQELDVIGSLIDELDSLREMYGEIERAAYAAVEEALRLQEANTTGNAKTSNGSTTTTTTTLNTNKNKNKGSGNGSSSDDGDSGSGDGDDSHPTFASSTSTKKGDGTPAVGDEVTYKSGRYYYDSYGSDPSGNQELGNKVRITYLNPGADFPIHISRLTGGDLGWLKKSQISGYDTGGYTGEWGDSGKLALLHEKELVLNKQDTPNILAAVSIVRDMASVLSNLESAAFSQMSGLMSATVQAPNIGIPAQTLEQDVRIEANFPNVSNSNEIEQAFNNLVNAASQHAFNTKR